MPTRLLELLENRLRIYKSISHYQFCRASLHSSRCCSDDIHNDKLQLSNVKQMGIWAQL